MIDAEERLDVVTALRALSDRTQRIVTLRLADYTCQEIGAQLGVTRGRTSQIVQAAYAQLRKRLTKTPPPRTLSEVEQVIAPPPPRPRPVAPPPVPTPRPPPARCNYPLCPTPNQPVRRPHKTHHACIRAMVAEGKRVHRMQREAASHDCVPTV